MDSLSAKYVSKYPYAASSEGSQVLLLDELRKIKYGYYASLIKPCREAYRTNKIEYARLKSKLPAITFCGVFKGSHKKENLQDYNNLMIIDIDNVPEAEIAILKSKLFSDSYVLACWISPSNNGLKLLIRVESDSIMHGFCFDRVLDHLNATYDVQADTSGSDVCRLCFISHDEDLLLKENSDIFPAHEDEWLISLTQQNNMALANQNLTSFKSKQELYAQSEKILLFKTEGRNKSSNRDMIKKIIAYLKKNNLSITGSYSTWLKVALAIANTFTYDVGRNIFLQLCRLDGGLHDEYKSEWLLEYCYRKRRQAEVNFGSIIYLATLKGFVISPLKSVK